MRKKTLTDNNRILNCIPSKNVEKDYSFEDALGGEIISEGDSLPSAVDLREPWWDVGNQKDTGSCVGWASTDSLLRWHFVKAGRITQKEKLSVRFIWMSCKEMDDFTSYPSTFIELAGTSVKTAIDIARKYGCVKEDVLPFSGGKLYTKPPNFLYAQASKLKVTSYFNLGTDPSKWRSWLAYHGPILTRLDCDNTWMACNPANPNLDVYVPPSQPAGHAVSIVGFRADGRFIIRNSWGTIWGDKGFAYASQAYAKDAFTEAYGISVY